MLFHVNFSNFIHTVSILLTLSLAIWRFIMIKFPTRSVNICTTSNCRNVLAVGFGKLILVNGFYGLRTVIEVLFTDQPCTVLDAFVAYLNVMLFSNKI